MDEQMTFWGHLEIFRRMFLKILLMFFVSSILLFIKKDTLFSVILAPSESDFFLYRFIRSFQRQLDLEPLSQFQIELVNTELSGQFLSHMEAAITMGLLVSSPYILFELYRFISPALYQKEKKYSVIIVISIYILFTMGILISYCLIFPISFRFFGTYQAADSIKNMITLSSYLSTFLSLSLMTGVAFELPIITYGLSKIGLIHKEQLKRFRPYALLAIMVISAIITPPDPFTLLLMSIPLYVMYEVSICLSKN